MDFDIKAIIDIKWFGYRKDANKGSVWGWFVFNGQPVEPLVGWQSLRHFPIPICYTFSGKIGKSLTIEPRPLTHEFLVEAKSREKNFKCVADYSKIMNKWGKLLNDELSMFLLAERLKL